VFLRRKESGGAVTIDEVLSEYATYMKRLSAAGYTEATPLTKKKVYEHRGWLPFYAEKHLEAEIQKLGLFYIPNKIRPGAAFAFPLRDAKGDTELQLRPLPGSYFYHPDRKYHLMTREDFLGPRWIGNDEETFKQLITGKRLLLVEGVFDVLACRCLRPNLPVMSPRSKTVGKLHVAYLRMLGVQQVITLFDSDKAGEGAAQGARWALQDYAEVEHYSCPAQDPSNALRNFASADNLKNLLETL
jgi:Toprim-like